MLVDPGGCCSHKQLHIAQGFSRSLSGTGSPSSRTSPVSSRVLAADGWLVGWLVGDVVDVDDVDDHDQVVDDDVVVGGGGGGGGDAVVMDLRRDCDEFILVSRVNFHELLLSSFHTLYKKNTGPSDAKSLLHLTICIKDI